MRGVVGVGEGARDGAEQRRPGGLEHRTREARVGSREEGRDVPVLFVTFFSESRLCLRLRVPRRRKQLARALERSLRLGDRRGERIRRVTPRGGDRLARVVLLVLLVALRNQSAKSVRAASRALAEPGGHLDFPRGDAAEHAAQLGVRFVRPRWTFTIARVVCTRRRLLRLHPLPRHRDERVLGHLRLRVRLRVVRVRVQHHHRERQHVRLVGVLEVARVALAVARREPLDEPIDLLRLARNPERLEENAKRLVQRQTSEVVRVRVRLHHPKRVDVVRTEQLTHRARVQRPTATARYVSFLCDVVADVFVFVPFFRVVRVFFSRIRIDVVAEERVSTGEKRGGAFRETRIRDVDRFVDVFARNLHDRRQRQNRRPRVERRRRRLKIRFSLLQRRKRLALRERELFLFFVTTFRFRTRVLERGAFASRRDLHAVRDRRGRFAIRTRFAFRARSTAGPTRSERFRAAREERRRLRAARVPRPQALHRRQHALHGAVPEPLLVATARRHGGRQRADRALVQVVAARVAVVVHEHVHQNLRVGRERADHAERRELRLGILRRRAAAARGTLERRERHARVEPRDRRLVRVPGAEHQARERRARQRRRRRGGRVGARHRGRGGAFRPPQRKTRARALHVHPGAQRQT